MQRGALLPLRAIVYTLMTVMLMGALGSGAAAQDANLLRDGGFEGSYTSRGRADLNLPREWSIWIAEQPRTEDWMNLPPVAFPHNGPDPAPHSGARTIHLNKGYATFTTALYQQVSVPNEANVTASAFAFLRTCEIADGAENCESSADSNAFTRIGIDPNGGTNPFDDDVVWSNNAAPHETWEQVTVSATTTGTTATLFLYATQQWPKQINSVYWDDATLSVGGTGGSAEQAPTDAPDDERVVHIVQAGETLDSIALTYGKTRDELLAINNIPDPRIIQIGQEIVIEAPPTPEPTPTSDATGEATAEAIPPDAVRFAAPAPVIQAEAGDALDPAADSAAICVTFFEDTNANRIQERGESVLADGQTLLTLDGTPAGQHVSDETDNPYCFEDLTAGNYVVTGVAPEGYGLTTPNELRVRATNGARIAVAFGAAEGIEAVVPPPADEGGIVNATVGDETDTRSTDNLLSDNIGLIVFGAAGVVLVAGLGVSLMMRRR